MNLHLGCGKRRLPGFVHVDLADFPHIDHRHDVRTLPMFADDSAGLIYACHVLEYFDRVEVRAVLAEWKRVLKPGGTLRLAVPDFAALVEVYRAAGDLAPILGPLFGRIEIATPAGPRTAYHRTVYDEAGLRATLEAAGFGNVRRWDWRQTPPHDTHDDFSQAYVPHLDKAHGRLISLNVEADK